MLPEKRTSTHAGEILRKEFLEPAGITQTELANHLSVPVQRVNELIRGKRGVTPQTAWLLGEAFGTGPEFWMNLQVAFDLTSVERPRRVRRLVA